jgi:rRNA maturation endonuclease Nob1
MSLGFQSLSTRGIQRRFEWTIYCPGCRRVFEEPQRGGVCPICGTQLKRKPGRKQSLREKARSGAEPRDEGSIAL